MSEQLETDDYVMKLVDPRDLIPYEQNSKIHSDDAITELADSMVGVGFNRSVSVSPEGGILAGHKSVLASIKNIERGHDSFKSIPVLVPKNRTDDQNKAFVLAENRQNEKSPFDFDIVSSELKALQEADFDIELTGFDISFIIDEVEPPSIGGSGGGAFKSVAFILHENQEQAVEDAIASIRINEDIDDPENENEKGNALAWLCAQYMSSAE